MIKIFSDFNCPFCFVQHERIVGQGLLDFLDFCFIEHAPNLNSESTSPEQLEQLNEEFEVIRQRGSDIDIVKPDFCVNTRLATLYFTTIYELDTIKAKKFSALIYRAYWRQGLDISKQNVLNDCLSQVGLAEVQISETAIDTFKGNQRQWLESDLDQRIPALKKSEGGVLLGLQHIETIRSFIEQEQFVIGKAGATCQFGHQQLIAAVGLSPVTSLFEQANQRFSTVHFIDAKEFLEYSELKKVSLVLFYVNNDDQHPWSTLTVLKQNKDLNKYLPMMGVLEKKSPLLTKQGFLLGATDVLYLDSLDEYVFTCIASRISNYQILCTLSDYALVDGLTGLVNKRSLLDLLNREWRKACRDHSFLTLIFLDVDNFKAFNDIYGHLKGDECLKSLASMMQEQLHRSNDVAARFGGEEFIILLPDTDQDGACVVIRHIQWALAQLAIPHSGNRCSSSENVTLSFGAVTAVPHPDYAIKEVLGLADKALYEAKSLGRNQARCTYFDPSAER